MKMVPTGSLTAIKVRNELTKKFGLQKSWGGDSNPYSPTQHLCGSVDLKNRNDLIAFLSNPENGWAEDSAGMLPEYVGFKKEAARITVKRVSAGDSSDDRYRISIYGPKKRKAYSTSYYD